MVKPKPDVKDVSTRANRAWREAGRKVGAEGSPVFA